MASRPRLRLCHLRRWEGMSYGFNFMSKKGIAGHFIDNIEYGFPAYYSGLKNGDRVVEVDGVDVTDKSHRDVVNMIKVSGKDGVKMLVVDIETERYFRDKGYTIKSNSNNYQIEFVACPLVKPDDGSNNSSLTNAQEVAHREVQGKSKKKSNQNSAQVPRPRLCHLRRWEGMIGYGFSLMSKKGIAGHFIENVNYGFPAYYSGLKNGDRVVEVDGVDVTDKSHRDVVNMIKVSGKDGVKMLVVDIETERYFRDKGYTIKSNSNNYQIEFVACPLVKPDDGSNNSSLTNAQEVAHREVQGKSKKKSNQNSAQVPRPRLCHLRRWEGMIGYGFSLMSKKGIAGHFIENVNYGFPAYYSGLKNGDRVVEVDGVDVTDKSHRDVVNMIKVSGKDGVKMLVVDIETERYFRDKGCTIKSNSNNYQIEFVACPLVKPDDGSNNSSLTNSAQEVTHREVHGESEKESNQRDSPLFKRFKRFSESEDRGKCVICLEDVVDHVCIPCLHVPFCEQCAQTVKMGFGTSDGVNQCPICREGLQDIKKIFFP